MTPSVLMAGLPQDLASWLERRLEGVTIRATGTGKETLDHLAQGHWSLLVIDHTLSDSEATEVLSQARNGLGLSELPVVYYLDKKLGNDLSGRLVDQLGVKQLLFHPVDREELARQVATSLGMPLPPARTAESRTQQHMQAAVAAIWERYKDAIIDRVTVVEQAAAALLEDNLDTELRRQAEREAHKLAGSVGTFGFAIGSRLAREAEQMLRVGATLGPTQARRLMDIVTDLRRALEQPPADRTPRPAQATSQPLLLIIDSDTELAERLVLEATDRGMRTEVVNSPQQARELIAHARPDAVLMDPSFQDSGEDALSLVAELSGRTPPVPVVVQTDRNSFADRVEVARLGGRGFLQKPVPPRKTIDIVAQALDRLRASEAKVMAVDDDPKVLEALKVILEAKSLRVTTLDEPLKFWEVLEKTAPDVLVLDVDMPFLSGIELCRVVRNDPRWVSLPVVFLTAYTDPDTVRRVYAAGADDFVGKPMVGPELIARIRNCMERTQLLRSMAETDSLTHVANRRKSFQVLEQFLRLADRQVQPVALAILNLDRFRTINDRFGFAAGDQVLRRLGVFLLQTFRSEDVVARWGGEEFVVGMYGMTRDDAAHRLAEVLETLRQEDFTGPEGERFNVTFSAGVAQYPEDGTDLETLYQSANEALHRAKAAGRDRVMPRKAADLQDQTAETADIVLVDDDEEMAETLIHALETRGYRTFWLQDGQAAVAALGGDAPCIDARLILLNVNVPSLDGLSVLKRLTDDGVVPRTKVIMLANHLGERKALQAVETDAFDCAIKPFSLPVLMRMVRRAVEN